MKRKSVICLGAFCLLAGMPLAQPTSATHADSGWVALFNGTTFDGLYTYISGTGKANPANQTTYVIQPESSMVKVSGTPAGFLGTVRQFSHYKVRVQWRWPAGTTATNNAGLLVHIDSVAMLTYTSGNRPRSIEVNMRRDTQYPFSLWSGQNFGPYITTKVTAVPATNTEGQYNPAGVVWTNDPWMSMGRVISGSLQTNPELPIGQWNTGEADLYGDSGTFIINGQIRTKGWDFQNRVNINNPTPRVACTKGSIGLQSESGQIFYRNYEIMELDSVTNVPGHATRGCTNRTATNYNSHAVVDNATCVGGTAVMFNSYSSPDVGARLFLNDPQGSWVQIPSGYSGAELYNLMGRKVWSIRGSNMRMQVPASVETGVLRVRLLP